jgi:hypothetical protein
MRFALPTFALLACISVGCISVADPYNYVYPGDLQTRHKKSDEIAATLKLLKKDDRDRVINYATDAQNAEQLMNEKVPDRTVAEIVDLEKAQEQGKEVDFGTGKIKESGDQQASQADLERQRIYAQKAADMSKLIQLSILNKQAILNDSSQIKRGDQVILTIGIANLGSKDIRALKGIASITTGDDSSTMDMSINAVLRAGKTTGWQGTINLGGPSDQPLVNADKSQLKITFQPQTYVFSDGTSMSIN